MRPEARNPAEDEREPDRPRDLARARPNTMRRIERSLESENSSPIENIRNTTPNSARCCAPSLSGTRPSRVRPDDDADGQIAEHRRQIQKAEHDDPATEHSSSNRVISSGEIIRLASSFVGGTARAQAPPISWMAFRGRPFEGAMSRRL